MFYSQEKQDEYLNTNVFKGYENGFFVDVGAHDGITINNTLYFQKKNNWKGINIEPVKEIYNKLVLNRPVDINLNMAISENDGVAPFYQNTGYTEMLSGLIDNYDPRHFQRLMNENLFYHSQTDVIQVKTARLETIFDQYNVKHVNYLSIDVEGAEFSVIKSINFNKVFIDVIGFESNYGDTSAIIVDYLNDKGFIRQNHTCVDIFMIHKHSQFNETI